MTFRSAGENPIQRFAADEEIASAVPCALPDLRAFYRGKSALLPARTGRVCRIVEVRARRGDTGLYANSSEYKAKARCGIVVRPLLRSRAETCG
jgi:hypothetical protein